ncbi:MAG: 23S rRNA (adenine(2503)-C(2))-methyltransferase RlmN, partial [Clostridia bacterium]
MSDVKIDIKSLSYEQLNLYLNEFGEKPFRTKQIFKWLHEKNILSFNEMTNLPKNLIEKLNNKFFLTILKTELILKSKIDNTIKFLFKLSDGQCIESVLMEYSYGNTICISSQAGCAMGCKFCASTIDGMVRNLSAGEIISQILIAQNVLGERISNIVLMGSGEPLDN